jgi:hypothetical protein
MKLVGIILVSLLLSACAQTSTTWGNVAQQAHDVSVQELLGRPEFFDGQPVRVVGVAGFNFSFEALSAIYATDEDRKHFTLSYIGIANLAEKIERNKKELEKLNGEFVQIEGTFRATKRVKFEQGKDMVICARHCGSSGFLYDVHFVSKWGQ